MIRPAAIVALAACALLLLAPAGAGAHRFNAPTTAEITSGGPEGAEGTVNSPRKACLKNRVVELFRESDLGGEDQSFGTGTTDAGGNWSISAPLFAGSYYVTVAKQKKAGVAQRSKKRKKKHRHRCKAGRSATAPL